MKIAVPVADTENTIFIRTGRAPFFAVYNVEDREFELLEYRENPNAHKHGNHNHNRRKKDRSDEHRIQNHMRHLRVIEDCGALLAVAVGPFMQEALKRMNIRHVKFKKSDGGKGDDFVRKFISGKPDSQRA